ncbi:hypothetical protein, partial [Streptomyces sp. UG1]|uniref:hypothetical protein n=1 Tax=Streptomyces sp. UG1 TaxID=3417652 RepID=UPI003CEB204D
MPTPHPSRRAVLAGTTAAAALSAVPFVPARAQAAESKSGTSATPAYRWRTAVMGGTGFVTGILFHPS